MTTWPTPSYDGTLDGLSKPPSPGSVIWYLNVP